MQGRSRSAVTVNNAPFGKVVWSELHSDFVSPQYTDVVFPHFARYVSHNYMAVF